MTTRRFRGRFFSLSIFAILFLFACPGVSASSSEHEAEWRPEVFRKDRLSLQLVSGLLFSPTALASRTPVMSYWMTNIRVGMMLNSPEESESFFRGNLETIVEFTNSQIFKGPGDYLRGVTVLFRYNFVQPGWKLFPFVQAGAGMVFNDAYKDRSQNGIGMAVEFTPQGSLGCRYLLKKNWSIDVEAMFHHISNAGLDERNRGMNAFGGLIGFTYFFDTPWR